MKTNIPLFILDWIVLLPITLVRLFLIYLYGSRYGIPGLRILDVMVHAEKPLFNAEDGEIEMIGENIVKMVPHYLSNNKEKEVIVEDDGCIIEEYDNGSDSLDSKNLLDSLDSKNLSDSLDSLMK